MSSADAITTRVLAPSEAALLTGLIHRCYGESYIDPSFYDVDAVRGRIERGQLSSIGAFTERHELVGHMGITLRSPCGITADAGMTLVDPAFRGQGIARRVAGGLAKQAMALGLVGVHDYPVTVHAATQRIGQGFGVDMGLMLANMPADVVFQQMHAEPARARTTSVIRWLPFGQSPERTVYLPARYRTQIESLYRASYLTRNVAPAGSVAGESKLSARRDDRRQTLRISIGRVGSDLHALVASETTAATREGALVAHADIRLGDTGAAAGVEALRELGFFFAGLLPEYEGGDILRMQRLDDSVDVAPAGVIELDSTRAIEAFVLEDRP